MATSRKTLSILAIFVAAVAVIAIAAVLNNNGGGQNDQDDQNVEESRENDTGPEGDDNVVVAPLGEASNSQLNVRVYDILVLNDTTSSPVEVFQAPFDGNLYVVLNVSVTNNMNETSGFAMENWFLSTTDDLVNGVTANVENGIPQEIQAGETKTFYMAFEMVADTVPSTLEYWGMEMLVVDLLSVP